MADTETTETFVATEPLYVGRARAHNAGDVLSAAQVERGGWQDQVASSGSDEADEVPGLYDPSDHSVEEVNTYLDTADDHEVERVLELEVAGKNRVTIVGQPDVDE